MNASKKASKHLSEVFSLVKAILLGRPNLSLDNRRRNPRLRLRVAVSCKVLDNEFPGELQDISSSGMRILSRVPIQIDDTVRVSATEKTGLVGRQRLICRVAWVRPKRPDYEIGLEYNDSDENLAHSWIQLALRHLDPEQVKRQARRIPANLHVQVSDADDVVLGQGICLNLSTGGCLLQMDRHLAKNELVKLGLGATLGESSIFLSGRVVSHPPNQDHDRCLHHVQFFPGENRHHSRLRSLLLSLLEEVERESLRDEPEVDLEEASDLLVAQPSLFERLGQPIPLPRKPQESLLVQEPDLSGSHLPLKPGQPFPLGAPIEYGLGHTDPTLELVFPLDLKVPTPKAPAIPLGQLLFNPAPLQTRNYSVRSTSLWAARNLPVSNRRRVLPRDLRHLDQEPEFLPPEERDFIS